MAKVREGIGRPCISTDEKEKVKRIKLDEGYAMGFQKILSVQRKLRGTVKVSNVSTSKRNLCFEKKAMVKKDRSTWNRT